MTTTACFWTSAKVVDDAYGLTPEERQLLRDTRPIPDPIDVLEANLAGVDPGHPMEALDE